MAASGSQSLARSPGVSAASHASRPDRLATGWVAIGPALVTLVVTLYRIGVPSFTRDEGATLLAVHRSFPQLIRMLGNVDVVHTEYYALIWAVSRLAGAPPRTSPDATVPSGTVTTVTPVPSPVQWPTPIPGTSVIRTRPPGARMRPHAG